MFVEDMLRRIKSVLKKKVMWSHNKFENAGNLLCIDIDLQLPITVLL